MKLTEEKIRELLPECKNRKELLLKLGFNNNGGTKRTLRNFCKLHNIDLTVFDTKLTKEKYEANPKHCLHCGKVIPYEKRENSFCDSSCAASYNNTNREVIEGTRKKIAEALQRRNKNFDGTFKPISEKANVRFRRKCGQKQFCLNCGKELSGNQTKFCCITCQQKFLREQYIERWKNGEENGVMGKYSISAYIRHYLLEKHNYCCEKCGWGEKNEFTGTIPLEIHHVDGDYRNNKEENLQVLCPNCHSLTETYKSHNKEGRKERKKYLLN